MDADLRGYVVRSVQSAFKSAFAGLMPGVPVFFDGQKYDPSRHAEYVVMFVSGPTWEASNQTTLSGELTVDAACFCRDTDDAHRIDEIAGAAEATLHRTDVAIRDYPSPSPTVVYGGRVRFRDAKSVRAPVSDSHAFGAGAEAPLRQINVSADGTAEIVW